MEIKTKTLGFDGTDEIIYSESFNVYEGKLIISDFLGKKFMFIFENTDPQKDQNDITVKSGAEKEIIVTLSKKFRNSLGSSTSKKLLILKTADSKEILFSIFGQQIGAGECLHVTVNFYIR